MLSSARSGKQNWHFIKDSAAIRPTWGGNSSPHFNKLTLDASYLKRSQWQQLPLEWRSQWQVQQSDSRLVASEQLSLGGQYTVRGFAEQSVQGASGFLPAIALAPCYMAGWTVPGFGSRP